MNKVAALLIGIAFLWGIVVPCQGNAQEIDPFYLQRLEGGERAFLEGDYETAVKELEIALFGIQGDKQLEARANVYLGLSHYYLGHSNEAKIHLREAKNHLGMEGLRALITNESLWFYLNRVLVDLGLMEDEQKQPAGMVIPPKIPGQKQTRNTMTESMVKNLEQQIKSNPRNVSLYYDLYDHHMESNTTKKAKKTLENLIKNNPTEAKAYYLLGRIQYQQRDLKDADRKLRRVFTLQKTVQVEDYVLFEAKAYHILCIYLQGERKRSFQMFAEWADHFTEERIRYLDLEEQDRAIFMGIAEAEETQAEIERLKSEALNVEKEEVEEPAPVKKQQLTAEQAESEATQQTNTGSVASGELKAGDLVPLDQVDTPPVPKTRVNPKYTPNAFAMGIEGDVVVNALISETGDVMEVVIVEGLPGGLNEETTKAVMQWKYEPAVKDGVKVKVWKQIAVTYKRR